MTETKKAGFLEEKCPSFVRKHYFLIFGLLYLILGVIIRIEFMDQQSGDAEFFLLPWYKEIKEGGGFDYLGTQVGDYNILYQTVIAALTYLPIKDLHAYKIFSCIFDLFLSVLSAYLVYNFAPKRKRLSAVAAFGAFFLCPLVFMNSSWWAQCDAIYTFFGIAALYLLAKKRTMFSLIVYGVAFGFKLQAIFLMPIFLLTIFCRKKWQFVYFLFIPAVMIVLSIPGILAGRSVMDVFTVYFNQTGTYAELDLNYPSVWAVPADVGYAIDGISGKELVSQEQLYGIFKYPAVLTAVAVLAVHMLKWMKRRVEFSVINIFRMGFLMNYTCVLFLPGMHERYGFCYEMLGLILAFVDRKAIKPLFIMQGITLYDYIVYFTNFRYVPMSVLLVGNLIAYIMYTKYVYGAMFPSQDGTMAIQNNSKTAEHKVKLKIEN